LKYPSAGTLKRKNPVAGMLSIGEAKLHEILVQKSYLLTPIT